MSQDYAEAVIAAQANDQHVVPIGDEPPHDLHNECWCEPRVDDGVPHKSGARVWIHNRLKAVIVDMEQRVATEDHHG